MELSSGTRCLHMSASVQKTLPQGSFRQYPELLLLLFAFVLFISGSISLFLLESMFPSEAGIGTSVGPCSWP